jgi:hypothetical protein
VCCRRGDQIISAFGTNAKCHCIAQRLLSGVTEKSFAHAEFFSV